jgi:thymidylate synthase
MMVAQACGLKPGQFIWTGGSVHIYSNHYEQVQEQLTREPRPAPRVVLDPSITNIYDFRAEHITLENYDPHPPIKAPIAV